MNALAIAIGIASPEAAEVIGFPVEQDGPTIVFDSELNADVFNSRATALCRGLGIRKPVNLIYRNVVGVPPNESFPALHDLAEQVGAVAVVIDSFGFATRGDPESYKDTRNNTTEYIDPLIAKGIAPIIVEHKPHQGNHIFGSVAKEYHGRFIFRVEDLDGDDRVKGERNTRLINEKASFTDEGQKISLLTRFSDDEIIIENLGVPDEDEDDSGSTADVEVKVRRALEKRTMTKDEIATEAAVSTKYLGNILPRMVRDRIIHLVGSGVPYVYGVEPPGPGGPPPIDPDRDTSTTFTIHRDVDVVDVPETQVSETAAAVTEPDELARIVNAISRVGTVALDLETMPPEGWVWEVVADYKGWRKGLKNKPKKDRMRAQWDKSKDAVYKRYAVNPETTQVRLISLATDAGLNEVVDVAYVDPAPVLEALKHKTIIAHNSSFDLGVLRERYGYIHEGRVLDTQHLYILHHYAEAGKPSVVREDKRRLPDPTKTKVEVDGTKVGMTSLKAVVKKYLPGVQLDKSIQAEDWSVPNLPAEMVAYSLNDSKVLLELEAVLRDRLEAIGMADIVEYIESRATPAKVWMERNGIPANKTLAEEMGGPVFRRGGQSLKEAYSASGGCYRSRWSYMVLDYRRTRTSGTYRDRRRP